MKRSIGSTSKYLLYRNSRMLLSQNYILSNSATFRTNSNKFWSSNYKFTNSIRYYSSGTGSTSTSDQGTLRDSPTRPERGSGTSGNNFSKSSSQNEKDSSLSGGYGGTTGYSSKSTDSSSMQDSSKNFGGSTRSGGYGDSSESSSKGGSSSSQDNSEGSGGQKSDSKDSSMRSSSSNSSSSKGSSGSSSSGFSGFSGAKKDSSTTTTTPKSSGNKGQSGTRSYATSASGGRNIGKGVGGTHGFSDATITTTGRNTRDEPDELPDERETRYTNSESRDENYSNPSTTSYVRDKYPTHQSNIGTNSMIYSHNMDRDGDSPRESMPSFRQDRDMMSPNSASSTSDNASSYRDNDDIKSSNFSASSSASSASSSSSSSSEKKGGFGSTNADDVKTYQTNVDPSTYTDGMTGAKSSASSMRGHRTDTTWKGEMPTMTEGLKEVVKTVGKIIGKENLEPETLKTKATDIAHKIKGTVKKNIGWAIGNEKLQEEGKRDLENQSASKEKDSKEQEFNRFGDDKNENREKSEFDRYGDEKSENKDKSEFNRFGDDKNENRERSFDSNDDSGRSDNLNKTEHRDNSELNRFDNDSRNQNRDSSEAKRFDGDHRFARSAQNENLRNSYESENTTKKSEMHPHEYKPDSSTVASKRF